MVTDAAGNVRTGVQLEVYPTRADALASTNKITNLQTLAGAALPPYVTSSSKGRYEFRIPNDLYDQVALKTPEGDVYRVTADEAVDSKADIGQDLPQYRGNVADQAAMVALTAKTGDWCIRTDLNARFDLTGTTASTAAHWTQVPSGGLLAEGVRDTVAAALVAGTRIEIVVDDIGDTITISTTATLNATDAQLRDRATHTGTQLAATISDLTTAVRAAVLFSQRVWSTVSLSWPARPAVPAGVTVWHFSLNDINAAIPTGMQPFDIWIPHPNSPHWPVS